MTKLEADTLYERDILNSSNDKRQIIEAVRKISQTEAYKTYLSSLNFIEKLKEVVRYRGYILYPLWVKIWKK